MDLEDLRRSPVGELIPISGEDARWGPYSYFAFMPSPLPEHVPLSDSTVGAVADAAMVIGRLDVAAERMPNPAILVRPTLRKEALSTSALEGTYAPLEEVLEGELMGEQAVSAEAREVINYIRAAESGVASLSTRPISLNLLVSLQEQLVAGTRGEAFDTGRIRERQVLIGSPDAPIADARFVPPPPGDRLRDGVSLWERWIHSEEIHLVVRTTLGHYQFETLHPFSDGNGRLGRLVMALQLIEGGAMKFPLLNIAEWLEPKREEYQDRLLEVSKTGDYDGWIGFLCRGIKEQSEAVTARIDRLLALRESFLERVRSTGSRGGTAYRLAGDLIGYPILDVPWVARRENVRYQSANEAMKRLVEAGILREVRRRGRTRKLFYADEVLAELGR